MTEHSAPRTRAIAAPLPALPWGEGALLLTVLFLIFAAH